MNAGSKIIIFRMNWAKFLGRATFSNGLTTVTVCVRLAVEWKNDLDQRRSSDLDWVILRCERIPQLNTTAVATLMDDNQKAVRTLVLAAQKNTVHRRYNKIPLKFRVFRMRTLRLSIPGTFTSSAFDTWLNAHDLMTHATPEAIMPVAQANQKTCLKKAQETKEEKEKRLSMCTYVSEYSD